MTRPFHISQSTIDEARAVGDWLNEAVWLVVFASRDRHAVEVIETTRGRARRYEPEARAVDEEFSDARTATGAALLYAYEHHITFIPSA